MGVAVQPVQTTAQTEPLAGAPGPIMDALWPVPDAQFSPGTHLAVHISFGHRQPVAAGRS